MQYDYQYSKRDAEVKWNKKLSTYVQNLVQQDIFGVSSQYHKEEPELKKKSIKSTAGNKYGAQSQINV